MQTLGTWVAVATTALLLPACATQVGQTPISRLSLPEYNLVRLHS
jgi:hypothetical protein